MLSVLYVKTVKATWFGLSELWCKPLSWKTQPWSENETGLDEEAECFSDSEAQDHSPLWGMCLSLAQIYPHPNLESDPITIVFLPDMLDAVSMETVTSNGLPKYKQKLL